MFTPKRVGIKVNIKFRIAFLNFIKNREAVKKKFSAFPCIVCQPSTKFDTR